MLKICQSPHLGIEPRTFGLEVQRAILCANGAQCETMFIKRGEKISRKEHIIFSSCVMCININNQARQLSWLERRANNAKVTGSIPLRATYHFLMFKFILNLKLCKLFFSQKTLVCLCWKGQPSLITHKRSPTTDRHGNSWLLGFPSGPFRLSSSNLISLDSPKQAMLMPSLVRTPIQHKSMITRNSLPQIIPNSDFPEARLQENATLPVKS